ncbi:MAG: hypothetical protein A2289_00645 [Deltaproteobacteria bacterium RIFOXYA12_FULL_58_15]|nr:MAG: hypothetical protein A2289_00645 [Deltaproteobacteria bacterium RIFOXYA12_FULL_58_15]
MKTRECRELLRMRLQNFPAVAIVGPRQCGKTTLAKMIGGSYFDLERSADQVRLDAMWNQLINGDELLILDEAQRVPDVFQRLRAAIDEDRGRKGRFLLLGSVSPSLMENVSESLAGRLAILELTPFFLSEIEQPDDLWLMGGYPDGGILDEDMFGPWQESYLALLTQRDLPSWGLPAKPQTTQRLIRMLAALHGQTLNASQLGTSMALDAKTIRSYLDYLEGAFLIRLLPPFLGNIKKRLVKSPKIFWRDCGLLHSILGVHDIEQLFAQPWVGSSWEGFVIEQTLSRLSASGKSTQAFYMRTSDQYELDLVLDWGTQKWAIESKLTSNPSPQMITRLQKTAEIINARRSVLVCRVEEPIESDELLVTDLRGWMRHLLSQ